MGNKISNEVQNYGPSEIKVKLGNLDVKLPIVPLDFDQLENYIISLSEQQGNDDPLEFFQLSYRKSHKSFRLSNNSSYQSALKAFNKKSLLICTERRSFQILFNLPLKSSNLEDFDSMLKETSLLIDSTCDETLIFFNAKRRLFLASQNFSPYTHVPTVEKIMTVLVFCVIADASDLDNLSFTTDFPFVVVNDVQLSEFTSELLNAWYEFGSILNKLVCKLYTLSKAYANLHANLKNVKKGKSREYLNLINFLPHFAECHTSSELLVEHLAEVIRNIQKKMKTISKQGNIQKLKKLAEMKAVAGAKSLEDLKSLFSLK